MLTTFVFMAEIGPSISISSASQNPNTIKASRIPLDFRFTPPTAPDRGGSSGMSDGGFGSEGSSGGGHGGGFGSGGGSGGGPTGGGGSNNVHGSGSGGGGSRVSTRPLSSSDPILNSLLQNMGRMQNQLVSLSQASSQPIF